VPFPGLLAGLVINAIKALQPQPQARQHRQLYTVSKELAVTRLVAGRGQVMRISVITPVLNKAAYIERCFASIVQQSHTNFEHIIIDGGSQDGTVDLIKQYARECPNVIWTSKPDRGQSHAMNSGLKLAQGDIIGFINADDYYEPDVFPVVDEILHSAACPAILFGNCSIWDACGNLWGTNKPVTCDLIEWLLPGGEVLIPVNPAQYFYTSDLHSLVGDFDEREDYAMDIDFLFRAVRIAKCYYEDQLFGNFRLISDAKTALDMKAGTFEERFCKLRSSYVASLSLRNRLRYEVRRIRSSIQLMNKAADL
jgi:glycosyltransferase involved in cell wall biosynthesis